MLDVGFPDSSVGTESTCNAGDPGLIPGLGRSPWRKDRLPIPVFWASLVAQKVKNPPAMLETWVRSLGWDNPLQKWKATHSTIPAWRIPWLQSMGSQRVGHDWATFTLTWQRFLTYVTKAQTSRNWTSSKDIFAFQNILVGQMKKPHPERKKVSEKDL